MTKEQRKIMFLPTSCTVSYTKEETILEIALKARLKINHSCGGMGTCGTCRVIIESDSECDLEKLPGRNEIEAEMAESRGFDENERLACQTPPIANLKVRLV